MNASIIKGNLIDLAENCRFDVIVHGCNCFCNMGAGIAAEIKRRYPQAFHTDWSKTKKGDAKKLGGYTWTIVTSPSGWTFTIINAYTQYDYGRKKNSVYTDYEAVRKVFHMIKKGFGFGRIGYPRIGAGLGGGDWNVIQQIINEELEGVNHTLVEYGGK